MKLKNNPRVKILDQDKRHVYINVYFQDEDTGEWYQKKGKIKKTLLEEV